jgi:predicted nuclease of predicted toxin-antitoxin system
MRHRKLPYAGQKLHLYADENLPLPLIEALRSDSRWRRKVSIRTASEAGNANRDDAFHFEYCRSEGLILVTLDTDFWDDRAFPLGDRLPAIIIIDARSGDDIAGNLEAILSFLTAIPFPNDVAGDSKFKVSNEGAVMRGRDAHTREIKTIRLIPGETTTLDVAKHFGVIGTD